MALAAKTGTILHEWPERQVVFDSDGSRIPDQDIPEIAEGFWGIVADAFKYSAENTKTIPASRSLMDFVREQVAEKYQDETEEVATKKRVHICREAEMWGAFVGSAVQRQSLKFFWLEECIEGENPFVASTYEKILREIARPAEEGADLRLAHKVTGVKSLEDGKVVVEVNGSKEEFDEVIVTSPLGWLQSNRHIFEPPLPSRLSDAIMNISYGTLDKVYITFETAFWETEGSKAGAAVGQEQAQAPNTTATVAPHHQSGEEGQEGQDDGHYPGFTLFYGKEDYTKPNAGIHNAMNMAALPASCAHPSLLFYIFGEASTEIAELVKDTPASELDSKLIQHFRPYFSLMPNYSAENPKCRAKAAFATDWASDELAGYGSYSTFRSGLEKGDEDIECMRHGMPERHVWLAGEHTAPFDALGTVTGAYWSGEGVAKRIVASRGG